MPRSAWEDDRFSPPGPPVPTLTSSTADSRFAGPNPAIYERCLGPLLSEPYTEDLLAHLPGSHLSQILELAAGTGILTSRLRAALPVKARLTATDLSEEMLALARVKHPLLDVSWRQADAHSLPFPDGAFDTAFCQFGFMFFADKPRACQELRRVLNVGSHLVLSVWDALEHDPLGAIARNTVNRCFGDDPSALGDVPFGGAGEDAIRDWLGGAGFRVTAVEQVARVARIPSAREAAEGIVAGTPTSIANREGASATTEEIVEATAVALAAAYGWSPCCIPTQALIVTARAV